MFRYNHYTCERLKMFQYIKLTVWWLRSSYSCFLNKKSHLLNWTNSNTKYKIHIISGGLASNTICNVYFDFLSNCCEDSKPTACKLTKYIWVAVITGQSSEPWSTHPQKTKHWADKCMNRDNRWPLNIVRVQERVIEKVGLCVYECEMGQHFSSRTNRCRRRWGLSSLFLLNHGMCCVCLRDKNNNKDHLTKPVFNLPLYEWEDPTTYLCKTVM